MYYPGAMTTDLAVLTALLLWGGFLTGLGLELSWRRHSQLMERLIKGIRDL